MKRKELKEYIRQEIIGTLSEVDLDKTVGSVVMKKGTPPADIKKMTTQGIDVELKEMSRKAGGYTIGDASKFSEATELYSTGLYSALLKAIEEVGEAGITQKELGIKLGLKSDSTLNPILNKFKAIGVISGGRLAAAEKPEKPEVEEPETEEPEGFEDIFAADIEDETPNETPEEKPEEKPSVSKADTGLAADIEKLAQLKNRLKSIMDKYRDESGKISDIEKYKQEIGDLPKQIKSLQDKIG